jgi:predicted permease
MLKDLQLAARMLLNAKGWTVVVVLSLALGIGANTAIFSAISGMLLTKIPVRDPDSLVRFRHAGRNDMSTSSSDYGVTRKTPEGLNARTTFSYPMFRQFVADNKTMTDLFACAPASRLVVSIAGQAELASGFLSTGNYYQMLGVNARLGRVIVPDDDRPDAPPVAVISSKYWHTRFGSDPNVVGKTIRLNNVITTIVGVLEPDFTGVQNTTDELLDVSFPLSLFPQIDPSVGPTANRLQQPTYWWLQVMGRLKPGATPEQVKGNLEAVFQNTARAGLAQYIKGLSETDRGASGNQNRTEVPKLLVEPGNRGIYDVSPVAVRSAMILSVVVVLVLLLVCANVANLLLSRAASRQKEISVRLSLGATRGRLIRQLLTESLLLASLGGALGLMVGYWGRQLLPGAGTQPHVMDWKLLAFGALVTMLTGLLFGIAPALRGTGVNVNSALKETSRGVVGSRSRLAKVLLVAQVAISLVLLVGAGLFLKTLGNLRRVDVGFNPQNLVLFRVNPGLNRYDEKKMALLYRDMLERLAAVPGVRGAAMSQPALLSGSVNSTSFYQQGKTYPPGRPQNDSLNINRLVISTNFFDVMGIPIVLGRALTERDDASAPKVAVINEAAARKFFPNENPIGRRFGSSPETSGTLEIVGVLRDAKYDSVRDPAPATMYVPYAQTRLTNAVFELRTAAAPSTVMGPVRDTIRQIDPNLPVTDVSTQIENVEKRFAQEKLFAQACTLFGALALVVAAVGLFGLMSYNVSRRTNEIGIRMALGAQRQDVLRLVMGESMLLVAGGIIAGLVVALASSRLVKAQLFELQPNDPIAIVTALGVMIAVAAFAGYLPARRASKVDPMIALHYE